ncbi:MAG: YdcF family protein [Gaiellaceae bacterium]
MRLVAVLGYSDRRTDALHPVCAARLARAEREVRPGDTVLLSGWARGRARAPEAELMARAWTAPARRVILDRGARSTLGNVSGVARAARRAGAREVVLVTSGWHGRRAGILARAALVGPHTKVTLATTDERGTRRQRARELACWAVVPVLALVAARTR